MRTSVWAMAVIVTLAGCSKKAPAGEPILKDSVQVTAASVPAASPAGAATADATRGFQKSYDEEALGHLDAALAALDDAPATPNASYVAALRRGWLTYRLGKNDDAIVAYRRAIALAPSSVEAKVGLLAPLGALRRWVDVEATARDLLRSDPASYQGTLRLAFALYSLARFAEAAAQYRALLTAYPSDVDAGAGLGWSLLKMGKKGEAASAFARVLEVAPRDALALDGSRAASAP